MAPRRYCASQVHFVGSPPPLAPLAPIEPLWLHALVLAAGGGELAAGDGSVAEEARGAIEKVVVASGRAPLAEFVRELDAKAAEGGLGGAAPAGPGGAEAGGAVVGGGAGESAYEKLRQRLMVL